MLEKRELLIKRSFENNHLKKIRIFCFNMPLVLHSTM